MSDDNDTPHAAAAAAPEASRGWSEQDRRTLIITLVGGLAANLATVILVGAAIALVRWHGPVRWQLVTALVISVGGLFMFAFGNTMRRGRALGPAVDLQTRFTGWVLVVSGSLLALEAVLIVVGLAAGVK